MGIAMYEIETSNQGHPKIKSKMATGPVGILDRSNPCRDHELNGACASYLVQKLTSAQV